MKLLIRGQEYDIHFGDSKDIIVINGLQHDLNYNIEKSDLEDEAKKIIKSDIRHWDFHHMSEYDRKKTKDIYNRELPGFPKYESGSAYGYGQVFRYEGDTTGCHNVMSGMTQKLSREISGKLNEAVEVGYSWAKNVIKHCKKELDFEKCLQEYGLLDKVEQERWKEKKS